MYFFCILALATVSLSASLTCPRCNTITEDVVWATDGKNCFVFRNECLLLTENCFRSESDKPLKKIPKKRCQLLCQKSCPDQEQPVCAEYNGKMKTFCSQCELNNYVCRTGETYILHGIGACDSVTIN